MRFRNGLKRLYVFVIDPPQEEPEPLMGAPFTYIPTTTGTRI